MNNNRFSLKITVFHGIKAPEEGHLVGYGAIIEAYKLAVPIPKIEPTETCVVETGIP